MLKSGVDVDAQDREYQTALHVAATTFRPSSVWFVETLLSYGANALIHDRWGLRALDRFEYKMDHHERSEDGEYLLRMSTMLSEATSEQSRSAQAMSIEEIP